MLGSSPPVASFKGGFQRALKEAGVLFASDGKKRVVRLLGIREGHRAQIMEQTRPDRWACAELRRSKCLRPTRSCLSPSQASRLRYQNLAIAR